VGGGVVSVGLGEHVAVANKTNRKTRVYFILVTVFIIKSFQNKILEYKKE
jgi:hypothetical protein